MPVKVIFYFTAVILTADDDAKVNTDDPNECFMKPVPLVFEKTNTNQAILHRQQNLFAGVVPQLLERFQLRHISGGKNHLILQE